ncbi:uncharacterized protein BDZ99DRAFT_124591 [Mytilinidion resinicola]|uniref:Uncharacterized protein n=1 Tax=Mytilinidion resinicola TaxID=574789 RepID=A0A6A6Z434_9PEZI|nr:uncharacterized protein BDZ99DRAFT_124591 [Mytilinidion resinicola]KAF2815846.1 hypothetical protein BDZ99DRAFT_124591 [Mytilinidion resinicola]
MRGMKRRANAKGFISGQGEAAGVRPLSKQASPRATDARHRMHVDVATADQRGQAQAAEPQTGRTLVRERLTEGKGRNVGPDWLERAGDAFRNRVPSARPAMLPQSRRQGAVASSSVATPGVGMLQAGVIDRTATQPKALIGPCNSQWAATTGPCSRPVLTSSPDGEGPLSASQCFRTRPRSTSSFAAPITG